MHVALVQVNSPAAALALPHAQAWSLAPQHPTRPQRRLFAALDPRAEVSRTCSCAAAASCRSTVSSTRPATELVRRAASSLNEAREAANCCDDAAVLETGVVAVVAVAAVAAAVLPGSPVASTPLLGLRVAIQTFERRAYWQ